MVQYGLIWYDFYGIVWSVPVKLQYSLQVGVGICSPTHGEFVSIFYINCTAQHRALNVGVEKDTSNLLTYEKIYCQANEKIKLSVRNEKKRVQDAKIIIFASYFANYLVIRICPAAKKPEVLHRVHLNSLLPTHMENTKHEMDPM